ncbi:hypothetical protein ACQPZJ_17385 [Actinoplanes sp. CA-054009]
MTPYVLAAYVAGSPWSPPAQPWTEDLPPEVVTVSDCLTELLPFGDDPLITPWHLTLADASSTARSSPAAQVLAVSVPAADADALAGMVEDWIGDYPHPLPVNLARRIPAPAGRPLGFEVLGFDAGRFHSWLCYGLRDQATSAQTGLLTSPAAAKRVAESANRARGTADGTPEDITWFPARITQHDEAR